MSLTNVVRKGSRAPGPRVNVLGILSQDRWAHAPQAFKKGAHGIQNCIYVPFVLVSML